MPIVYIVLICAVWSLAETWIERDKPRCKGCQGRDRSHHR